MLRCMPPGAVEGPARPREVAVRKVLLVALAVLVAAALALPASAGASGQAGTAAQAQPSGQFQSANGEYVVAYADGVAAAAAEAAGGTILKENTRVGVATVNSANPSFLRCRRPARPGRGGPQPAHPKDPERRRAAKEDVERLTAAERAAAKSGPARQGTCPARSPSPTGSGTCG